MLKEIIKKITEYSQIVIYRHIRPDYDAFGSQYGLYYLIKENFVNKDVYLAGDFSSNLVEKYTYQGTYELADFTKPTLGIVLDTANRQRIDGDYSKCQELIKIDHHLLVDDYGTISYVDEQASSCAQLIGEILKETNFKINKAGAEALYMGIVGDTNRFLYSSTSCETFKIASILANYCDLPALYERMYLADLKDLKVQAYILNNFIVNGKIAYYLLTENNLQQLQITREEGSNYVQLLGQTKEFAIWLAITENINEHNWRVSLRSRHYDIHEIAGHFHGGGHALASGATLSSLAELPLLIDELKALCQD